MHSSNLKGKFINTQYERHVSARRVCYAVLRDSEEAMYFPTNRYHHWRSEKELLLLLVRAR